MLRKLCVKRSRPAPTVPDRSLMLDEKTTWSRHRESTCGRPIARSADWAEACTCVGLRSLNNAAKDFSLHSNVWANPHGRGDIGSIVASSYRRLSVEFRGADNSGSHSRGSPVMHSDLMNSRSNAIVSGDGGSRLVKIDRVSGITSLSLLVHRGQYRR